MFESRRFTFVLAVATTLLLVTAGAGRADTSLGLHGGFSSGPDQFVIGPHLNLSAIADHLYIVPSGELGFGDNLTTIAVNGDVQYRFVVHRSKVRPYAGGGLTLFIFDPKGPGGSDNNLGINALGGIYFGSHRPMFLDLKAGLSDKVPDWKLQLGINF